MIVLRCTNDEGIKYDLDVLDNLDFKLDISAIESGDIGKVFGVSSQNISLPPTKNNNEFFGNLYDVGATPSTSFIKTVPCQILQNGQEIFTGKLYVDSVITDNMGDDLYNVVIVNETVDFNFLIKDTTFGDLDFSFLNHDYTYGNITSSWDGNLEGGAIFYPLVNYGFDEENPLDTQIKGGGEPRTFTNTSSPIRVDDFKPAIRIRECLDAIFNSVNYEYTSSLFAVGSELDTLYMLATKDDKKGISSVNPVSQSFRAYTTSSQDYPGPSINQQVYFGAENYDNSNQFDGRKFTAGADGTYQFEINLVYEILNYSAVGDTRSVDVKVFKNGSQFDLYNFDLTGVVQGQINTITQYYALNATDTIDIRVSFTKTGVGLEEFRIISSGNSRFKLLTGPTTLLGGVVDIAQTFNNIKVPEFLQGLIEKFNLVIEPVKDKRNVLSIETFNDWVDAGEVKDWSNKVDFNQKWEIRHPLQNQPKNIKFTDIEDQTALTQYHKRTTGKLYGEFDYISESDLASGEKQIGKFFAPTPMRGIPGSPQTVMPILAEKDDSTQPFARTVFAPRLLFRKSTRQDCLGLIAKTGAGALVQNQYYFEDENGTVHTETDYGLASHLQTLPADFNSTLDLHFGNTFSPGHYNYHQPQFNGQTKRTAFYEYWSYYINELYDIDSRLVTLNVLLAPNEIPQISLNDKIFIDGHYYRINKIKGANISREASIEVELIKTLARKLRFPRRRIIGLDNEPVDIVVSDNDFDSSGRVAYNDFETGNIYTGSALTPAADRDGFAVYGNDVIWDNKKPTQVKFTSQANIGLNRVDESAEVIDVRGDNNTISNNVLTTNVAGSDNSVASYAKFITVTGTENIIEQSVENSAIQQSTTSTISQDTQLSTIIGGEGTIISGSNQSVTIGQNTTTHGGNSNIVIGNYNSQTKTIKDMINTVVINPNRDLESRNTTGEDFDGRAYIGSYQEIGSHHSDNKTLTLSAGQTLYLTGSDYTNDSVYNVSWSGGDGFALVYLPEVDVNIPTINRDSGGYKRYLRFTTDGTFDAGKNVGINVASGEYLNGTLNGGYTLDAPYQNFEIYGVSQSYWRVLEAGVPDITNGGHAGAYGSFFSTADQTIAASGSAQLVTLNSTQASNKIALSGSGAIQMDYNGAYNFTYTATVQNADNVVHYAYFWVKYNGTDYPNSTTKVSIPARKSATEFTSRPVTVNLLDVAVNDGDKIELYWRGDSTLLSLNYETYGGVWPASPSIRATIQAV